MTIELAAVEDETQERHVVGSARVEGVSHVVDLGVGGRVHLEGRELPVLPLQEKVGQTVARIGALEVRGRHAEWLEYLLVHESVDGATVQLRHEYTHPVRAHAVREALAGVEEHRIVERLDLSR